MHFNELEQIPPGLAWNPSVLYIPGHSTWNPVQWNEEFGSGKQFFGGGLFHFIPLQ